MSVAVTLPLPVRVRLPLLRVKRKAGASARGVIAMPVGCSEPSKWKATVSLSLPPRKSEEMA